MVRNMNKEAKLTLIHALVGLLVGYISPTIKTKTMILFGVVIVIMLGEVTQRIFKRAKFIWWFSNGAMPYLTIWFLVWTLMNNM